MNLDLAILKEAGLTGWVLFLVAFAAWAGDQMLKLLAKRIEKRPELEQSRVSLQQQLDASSSNQIKTLLEWREKSEKRLDAQGEEIQSLRLQLVDCERKHAIVVSALIAHNIPLPEEAHHT